MAIARRVRVVLPAVVALTSGSALAASIDHAPVGCVEVDRFPRFEARVTPLESAARARVFFRATGTESWYAVAMKPEGDVLAAFLPKPQKTLSGFEYYIEVAGPDLHTSRTEERTAKVAAGGCGSMKNLSAAAATVLLEIPAGAAGIPLGFSGAGVVAAAGQVTGAAAAGAAGASGGGGTGAAAGAGAAGASGGGGLGTTALVVGGAGIAAVGGAAVVATSGGSTEGPIRLAGYVYSTVSYLTGSPVYGSPVVGAVVSTSLDSVTGTTDATGHFDMMTTRGKGVCPYTITIQAAGFPTYSVTGGWGDGAPPEQTFVLSPPSPSFVGPCQ